MWPLRVMRGVRLRHHDLELPVQDCPFDLAVRIAFLM
jgi:hypothetical protein